MEQWREVLREFWPEEADAAGQDVLAEALAGVLAAAYVSRGEYEEVQAALAVQDAKVAELERAAAESELLGRQRELEYRIVSALREAGAKNLRAVEALLDMEAIAAAEDMAAEIERQVLVLKQAADSAFLFGMPGIGGPGCWSGFVPADSGDIEAGTEGAGFRLRLDRARAQGDGLSVIRLKQEAAREGVML